MTFDRNFNIIMNIIDSNSATLQSFSEVSCTKANGKIITIIDEQLKISISELWKNTFDETYFNKKKK